MADEAFTSAILKAIKHAPEWLRQDLTSQDPNVRMRAEETLAAIVAAAALSARTTEGSLNAPE
jgi:hypothetical protein